MFGTCCVIYELEFFFFFFLWRRKFAMLSGLLWWMHCVALGYRCSPTKLYGANLEDKLVMSNTNNFIKYSCLWIWRKLLLTIFRYVNLLGKGYIQFRMQRYHFSVLCQGKLWGVCVTAASGANKSVPASPLYVVEHRINTTAHF